MKLRACFHAYALITFAQLRLLFAQTSEADAWRSLNARGYVLDPPRNLQTLRGHQLQCEYFGHMYSYELIFSEFFDMNPRSRANDWQDADFVVLPHCVTYAYHILRYQWGFSTVHLTWEALRIVQDEYLLPLVHWAKSTAPYSKKPFVIVFAMDKGRADYPLVSHETKDWIAITTVGNPKWMATHKPWSFPLAPLEDKDPCFNNTSISRRALVWYPQDVVAPVMTTFSPTNRSGETRHRDLLFFFSGTANSCTRRMIISEYAHRRSDRFLVTEKPIAKMDWATYLHRSKFCLVPDGFSSISARLFEVLLHGCVPVIISEAFHPHRYVHISCIHFCSASPLKNGKREYMGWDHVTGGNKTDFVYIQCCVYLCVHFWSVLKITYFLFLGFFFCVYSVVKSVVFKCFSSNHISAHSPFEDMIDWRTIAVFLRREQIPFIEERLDSLADQYLLLHRKISQVSMIFDVGSATSWIALFSSLMHQIRFLASNATQCDVTDSECAERE
eukprot:GEMP01039796.1.p1 GENE.GEMP01039796.1~~GEMP01039796.1.p1  ORF type:complete len:501 (+),score=51.01 GEMP01039796.1:188-1690(+)